MCNVLKRVTHVLFQLFFMSIITSSFTFTILLVLYNIILFPPNVILKWSNLNKV